MAAFVSVAGLLFSVGALLSPSTVQKWSMASTTGVRWCVVGVIHWCVGSGPPISLLPIHPGVMPAPPPPQHFL